MTRFVTDHRERRGLDIDDADVEPIDEARARTLQVPLPARPLDPAADQLEQVVPYRCAFFEGFSLHANVDVPAHDRDGLLRLVRYGARQAFSQKQMRELPDAALIPQPYLTSFHGIFAPNANRRNEVCPQRSPRRRAHRHPVPADEEPKEPPLPLQSPAPPASRIHWAELLKRTLGLDVLKCRRCPTGALVVLAFITEAAVVLRILRHLELPTE